MGALESLKRNFLSECEEDHVGLWSVIREVEDFFPAKDESALRSHVLTLLHDLLVANKIQAGFPAPDGQGFHPVQIPPNEILAQIEAEWPADRRPTIGEGLWFTTKQRA